MHSKPETLKTRILKSRRLIAMSTLNENVANLDASLGENRTCLVPDSRYWRSFCLSLVAVDEGKVHDLRAALPSAMAPVNCRFGGGGLGAGVRELGLRV